jgi:hypothetical protein
MGVCASAPPADGGSASIPVPVKPAGGSVEWSDDVPSAYTTTSSSAMPSINSAPNIATVRNIVRPSRTHTLSHPTLSHHPSAMPSPRTHAHTHIRTHLPPLHTATSLTSRIAGPSRCHGTVTFSVVKLSIVRSGGHYSEYCEGGGREHGKGEERRCVANWRLCGRCRVVRADSDSSPDSSNEADAERTNAGAFLFFSLYRVTESFTYIMVF